MPRQPFKWQTEAMISDFSGKFIPIVVSGPGPVVRLPVVDAKGGSQAETEWSFPWLRLRWVPRQAGLTGWEAECLEYLECPFGMMLLTDVSEFACEFFEPSAITRVQKRGVAVDPWEFLGTCHVNPLVLHNAEWRLSALVTLSTGEHHVKVEAIASCHLTLTWGGGVPPEIETIRQWFPGAYVVRQRRGLE
jgi:hypothetical protein